jgi:3',5'-cyclic AMP phosphodiesterase CpdA
LNRLKELTGVLPFLLILGVTLHVVLIFEVLPNSVMPRNEKWTYYPNDPNNFTIIVLPDTQFYSESYPEIFDNQTQWIIDNIGQLNIVFVTHLGDLVDEWEVVEQWENANRSMSRLDGNVPWGVLPGNHDFVNSNKTNYLQYFGVDRFINESWYGGACQNSNMNSYQLFSAGGDDYLIFHLQYVPSNETLLWASSVIDSYPTRRVIVSTHYHLDYYSSSGCLRSDVGEMIWQTLVEPHADQIFLVLCGHIYADDYRTVTVDGHFVCELLSDYQYEPKGGNGWLKILYFSPSYDKIFVKTYSPYLNEYDRDSESEFVLDYDMTSS